MANFNPETWHFTSTEDPALDCALTYYIHDILTCDIDKLVHYESILDEHFRMQPTGDGDLICTILEFVLDERLNPILDAAYRRREGMI